MNYIYSIRDLFKKHNISLLKKNQAILMMILYICVIKYLVNRWRIFELTANYVKHKGNKVFEFNKM